MNIRASGTEEIDFRSLSGYLAVVLCGERDVQPVINAGTLYA